MAKNEPKGEIEVLDTTSPDEIKDCFIITPIGSDGSDTFIKADGLIRSVIEPVLSEFGYKAIPAYKIDATGSITKQIIDHIFRDDLVIANLTGNNPNVMYELAIRHSFGKKVISMAEHGTKLPFDISDQRTIFYHDSLSGSEIVKPKLRSAIEAIINLDQTVITNPVFDAVKEIAVVKSVDAKDQNVTQYLLNRFDRLERLVLKSNRRFSTELDTQNFIESDRIYNSHRVYIKFSAELARLKDVLEGTLDSCNINNWNIRMAGGNRAIIEVKSLRQDLDYLVDNLNSISFITVERVTSRTRSRGSQPEIGQIDIFGPDVSKNGG